MFFSFFLPQFFWLVRSPESLCGFEKQIVAFPFLWMIQGGGGGWSRAALWGQGITSGRWRYVCSM